MDGYALGSLAPRRAAFWKLTLWSVPFSQTGLRAFALMSESKFGSEEYVDPSSGSFLESSAESIPGHLFKHLPATLRRSDDDDDDDEHAALPLLVGEFAAYTCNTRMQ